MTKQAALGKRAAHVLASRLHDSASDLLLTSRHTNRSGEESILWHVLIRQGRAVVG